MPDWKFLAKHLGPEVRAAWDRDVGLPDRDFIIGYSGSRLRKKGYRPLTGAAHSAGWSHLAPEQRKHFTYDPEAKRWTTTPPRGEGEG